MRHSLHYYSSVDALIMHMSSRPSASAQKEISMLAELHAEDDIGMERRFNSRLALMADPEVARYVQSEVTLVLAELEHRGLHIDDPDRFRTWWCEAYVTRYQALREQISPSLPYCQVVDRLPECLERTGIIAIAQPPGSWRLQFPLGTVRHPPIATLTYVDWVLTQSVEVIRYTLPSGQGGHYRYTKRLDTQQGTWLESAVFKLDRRKQASPR